MPALLYVSQLLSLIPGLVGAGQSIMGVFNTLQSSVANMQAGNRGPTADEIAALRALTDSVHAQIQAIPDK
jgi:hypothetical protein